MPITTVHVHFVQWSFRSKNKGLFCNNWFAVISDYSLESRVACSGESTHLPPMWRGFDFLTCCHTWIDFVGSLLCCSRFFPGGGDLPMFGYMGAAEGLKS